jgi:hypothetical protein
VLDATGKFPAGSFRDTVDFCEMMDYVAMRNFCRLHFPNVTIGIKLARGNGIALGNFDECIHVEASVCAPMKRSSSTTTDSASLYAGGGLSTQPPGKAVQRTTLCRQTRSRG